MAVIDFIPKDFISIIPEENEFIEEKLRDILNVMEQKNNCLYKNLEKIYEKSNLYVENQEEMPRITVPIYIYKDELINYTKEFLYEIDPSNNLRKKFTKMLENNQICIWYRSSNYWKGIPYIIANNFPLDCIYSPSMLKNNDKVLINLPLSGQLEDFSYIIHEFFHSLFISDKQDNILNEIIPIILEKYTRSFLEKKEKYSKEFLDYVYAERTRRLKEALNRSRKAINLLLQVKKGISIDSTNEDFIYYYLYINYQSYSNLFQYLVGTLIANYIEDFEEERKEKIITNIVNNSEKDIVSNNIKYFFDTLGLPELNLSKKQNSLKYLKLLD